MFNIYRSIKDEEKFKFFGPNKNIFIIKYENLIKNPEASLEKVCEFIEEDFQQNMLEPGARAKALIGKGEWWKNGVTQPLDHSRLFAWKKVLPRKQADAATRLAYDFLEKYEYEISIERPQKNVLLCPLSSKFIENYESVMYKLTEANLKITGIDNFQKLDCKFDFQGNQDLIFLSYKELIIGRRIIDRIKNIFSLLKFLLQAKIKGRMESIFFLPLGNFSANGKAEMVLHLLLCKLKKLNLSKYIDLACDKKDRI